MNIRDVQGWTSFPCLDKQKHINFYQELLFLMSLHTGHTVADLNYMFAGRFGISVLDMDLVNFRRFIAVVMQVAMDLGVDIQDANGRL